MFAPTGFFTAGQSVVSRHDNQAAAGLQAMIPLYQQMLWQHSAGIQALVPQLQAGWPFLRELQHLGITADVPPQVTLSSEKIQDITSHAQQLHQQALRGIELLQTHLPSLNPPARLNAQPVFWQKGAARCFQYMPTKSRRNTPPILMVPSLINRAYVFDIQPEHSMVQYFLDAGYPVLVLDWADPAELEQAFSVSEYTTELLLPLLEKIALEYHQPAVVIGYCMGGLLTMAAAQLRPDLMRAMALLATPWDFRVSEARPLMPVEFWQQMLEQLLGDLAARGQHMSGQMVHALMYLRDPWKIHRQLAHFATLLPESAESQRFLLRQYWLHDHVPLTLPMARQAFMGWALHNHLMIEDTPLRPHSITLPVYLAMPQYDSIVPPASSAPLAALFQNVTTVSPPLGHLGVMMNPNAALHLWKPLEHWLQAL